MANVFMCSVEEKLKHENKLPSFYKNYADNTLALERDHSDATDLLTTLNEAHPSIQFTMEAATNNHLPFIGMEIIKVDHPLETCVYRKTMNKGLLLHFQSHVDGRYKWSLLRTMLDRAKRLSSTPEFLTQECKNIKGIFLKSKYPDKLIDVAINRVHHPPDLIHTPSDSPIRIIIPYKDQKSADVVRKQLRNLGRKIDHELQPNFTSTKIADDLRETEFKPPIVNQQSVVYEYKCDLCNTNYIGYTRRHLHQCVEEHKHSVIGKHLKDEHSVKPSNLRDNFTILKKCRSKLECLIFKMLYTQADSIRAYHALCNYVFLFHTSIFVYISYVNFFTFHFR